MKAVFLPSHFDGDGYYRLLFPARELGRRGWDVSVAPHRTVPVEGPPGASKTFYGVIEEAQGGLRVVQQLDSWLMDEPFDVLVTQLRDEPGFVEVVRQLQEVGKRVVVDSDDCWIDLPAWNPGSKRKQAELDAAMELLRVADGVSVATPALADVYSRWCDATVIRNRLDWPMWEDVTPAYEVTRRRVRVGWMGEMKWRRGEVQVLKEMLLPWLLDHPEVEFVAAGDPTVHDVVGTPLGQRVSTNRVPFAAMDLADITATFDIGLVPLADGSQGSRRLNDCKSHLKGMEYAACGIPCIATPTESYRWWLEDGDCDHGFLASTAAEWRDALDTLLDNGIRERMGRAARAAGESSTIQEHVHEWTHFLTGVCADTDFARPLVAAR